MTEIKEMDISVFIGPVQAKELQASIDGFRPTAEYAILESLTDIKFPNPQSEKILLEEWDKGHLFRPTFELRWEKADGGYRSILAKEKNSDWPSAASNLEKLFLSTDEGLQDYLPDHEREPYAVFLRPENDASLGRRLCYECIAAAPSKKNGDAPNAVLQIKRYFDANGRLIFWRYQHMSWEVKNESV